MDIFAVLVNLVLNAHEAVDGHGEIRVVTERINGWAVLSVRDNGCGMSRAGRPISFHQRRMAFTAKLAVS